MKCFRDVIASFPTRKAFAEGADISVALANIWYHRNRIPATQWTSVVNAARKNGVYGITTDLLANIASHQTIPQPKGGNNVSG